MTYDAPISRLRCTKSDTAVEWMKSVTLRSYQAVSDHEGQSFGRASRAMNEEMHDTLR